MRPAAAALALAALACGCASPPAPRARPLAPACDLVLEDARPPAADEPAGVGATLAYLVPLLPCFEARVAHLQRRSLLPEVRAALAATGLFGQVLGPGDPSVARAAAPYVVRVVVEASARRERGTSYGLGLAGLLLHLLGAPSDFTTTSVRLRVACGPRDAPPSAAVTADASATDPGWLLETRTGEDLERDLADAVREALVEGLGAHLGPE